MVVESSMPGHGFEVGDMVWAKLKSEPWSPGYVYSEEFATPLVRKSKREGLILVALFGRSSFSWFESSDLLPFDSNYAEKSLQANSRQLVKAVEKAIDELNRRSDLALSCTCQKNHNIRKIDASGYDPVAFHAIGKARDSFQPKSALGFLRELALEPSEHVDIDFIKNKATVMSYRKAVFQNFDATCDPACGYKPVQESPPQETSAKAPSSREDESSKQIEKENERSALTLPGKDPTAVMGGESEPIVRSTDDVQELEDRKVISFSSPVGSGKKTQQKKEGISLGSDKETVKPERSVAARALDDLHSLAVDPFNAVINRRSRTKIKKTFLRFRSLVFLEGQNFSLAHAGKFSEDGLETPQAPSSGSEVFAGDTATVNNHANDDAHLIVCRDESQEIKKEIENVMSSPLPLTCNDPTTISAVTGESEPKVTAAAAAHDEKRIEDIKVFSQDDFPSTVMKRPKRPDEEIVPENKKRQKNDLLEKGSADVTDLSRVLGDLHSLAVDPGSCVKGTEALLRFRSLVFRRVRGHPKSFGEGGPKRGPSDRLEEMAAAKKMRVGEIRNLTKDKKVSDVKHLAVKRPEPEARDVKQPAVKRPDTQDVKQPIIKKPEPEARDVKLPAVKRPDTQDVKKPIINKPEPETPDVKLLAVKRPDTQDVKQPIIKKPEPGTRDVKLPAVKRPDTQDVKQPIIKKSEPGIRDVKQSAVKRPDTQDVKQPIVKNLEPGTRDVKQSAVKTPETQNVKQPIIKKPEPGTRDVKQPAVKRSDTQDVKQPLSKKPEPGTRDVKQPAVKRPDTQDVKQPIIKKPEPGPRQPAMKRPEPEKPGQRAPDSTMLIMKFPKGGSLPTFNELKARFSRYGPMDHSATQILSNTFSCQVVFRYKAHAQAAYKFVVGSSSVFGNTGVRCRLKQVGSGEQNEDHLPADTVPVTGVQTKSIQKGSGGEEVAGRGHVKFTESQNMENRTSFSYLKADSSLVTGPSTIQPPPAAPASSMHNGTTPFAPQLPALRVLDQPMDAQLVAPNADVAQQMLSLLTRCKDVVTHVSYILGYTPYHPL